MIVRGQFRFKNTAHISCVSNTIKYIATILKKKLKAIAYSHDIKQAKLKSKFNVTKPLSKNIQKKIVLDYRLEYIKDMHHEVKINYNIIFIVLY